MTAIRDKRYHWSTETLYALRSYHGDKGDEWDYLWLQLNVWHWERQSQRRGILEFIQDVADHLLIDPEVTTRILGGSWDFRHFDQLEGITVDGSSRRFPQLESREVLALRAACRRFIPESVRYGIISLDGHPTVIVIECDEPELPSPLL